MRQIFSFSKLQQFKVQKVTFDFPNPRIPHPRKRRASAIPLQSLSTSCAADLLFLMSDHHRPFRVPHRSVLSIFEEFAKVSYLALL